MGLFSNHRHAIVVERRVNLFAFLLSLLLLFCCVLWLSNVLVSFLLALVNYFLLAPSVDFMESRGLSRVAATAIPFMLLTAVLSLVIYLLVPDLVSQMESLGGNSQKYVETATALISRLEDQIGSTLRLLLKIDFRSHLDPQLSFLATSFLKQLPAWVSRSATVGILSPFFAFFMLLQGRDFVRQLIGLVPNNSFELAINLNYQIGHQIGGFIRARLVETIVVGALLWMGLSLLEFPYSLILAFFAALLNIIPYLGPVIGAIPVFLISLSNGFSPSELLQIAIIFGGVQLIDTLILVPFLVAKIVNLHPVTVVLSILAGAQLMGVLGMIICIPVISVLKVTTIALYRHFTSFRG